MANQIQSIAPETLSVITHNNIPVITTNLLAQLYCTDDNNIIKNFQRNTDRFIEGKHYFKLEGKELREFKHCMTNCHSVEIARQTRNLILWTERGAARHAKMLDTDQAWKVFERLEDCYFEVNKPSSRIEQQIIHSLKLTDDELYDLAWLFKAAYIMRETLVNLSPALNAIKSDYASNIYSLACEYKRTLDQAKIILIRETAHIDPYGFLWQTVLPELRNKF